MGDTLERCPTFPQMMATQLKKEVWHVPSRAAGPCHPHEAQIANSICPLLISNIARVCLLNILEEAQLTDVAYWIIWVIRPLHFVGVPKVSHLLPAMCYSKVRGARGHLGNCGDGPGIYGPCFICEHIIHVVKFQVYQDFWSVNEAC